MSAAVSARPSRARNADPSHLICPRCGLTITPKPPWLSVEHCPRCIARARIAVTLFCSPLPTNELHAPDAAPGEHLHLSRATKGETRWEP